MALRTKPRIIYNADTCSLRLIDPPHDVDQIRRAYDYLEDTQVDWMTWSMTAGDMAYSYKSEIVENSLDIYKTAAKTSYFGKIPDRNLLISLYERGIDYLPILIDALHERDIGFFGSFRMNDSHHKSDPQGILAGQFWKENQHLRNWAVQTSASYHNATLDYSHEIVRERRYAVIEEVVNRYDVDGVELDFMRNRFTFPPAEAWEKRNLLTKLIVRVRRLLDRVGKKRGRKLRLILRLPAREEWLRMGGMDLETWLKRGYPDVISLSCHYSDYSLDPTPYRDLAHKHGVLYYIATESNVGHNRHPEIYSPPYVQPPLHNDTARETAASKLLHVRSFALNMLEQGTDGTYMFNHPCFLFEQQQQGESFRLMSEVVLNELGSKKTLRDKPMEYTFWEHLPIYIESRRPAEYYQTIPFRLFDPRARKRDGTFTLSWRQIAERNPHATGDFKQSPYVPNGHMEVRLNGHLLEESSLRKKKEKAGKLPSLFTIGAHELVTVEGPARFMKYGVNELAFEVPHFPERTDPYIYIYELRVTVG